MVRNIFWWINLPFKWWAHTALRKGYTREIRRCAQKLLLAEALGEKEKAVSLWDEIQRLQKLDRQEIRDIAKFHGIEEE